MSITHRYVTISDTPASPDVAQNINRVDAEIHPFPHLADDHLRYVVPPFSVVCAHFDEDEGTEDSAFVHVTEQQLREGIVTHVFSNFLGLNFTTTEGKKEANRRRLRFFGIANGQGMLASQDIKDYPVSMGRFSPHVSGLTPVNNDLKYLKDAIPGDYVEIIFVDSGGRWTEHGDDYGTPILRTVKAEAFDGPRGYHGGDGGTGDHSPFLATMAYESAAIGAQTGATALQIAAALAAFEHKHPEESLGVSFNDNMNYTKGKLAKLGYKDASVNRAFELAGITTETENASAVVAGGVNPFMRLPAAGSPSVLGNAFFLGTPNTPSLADHIRRVLDPTDNGATWKIPSTARMFVRFVRHVKKDTIENAKTEEDKVTKTLTELKTKLAGAGLNFSDPIRVGMSHVDYLVGIEMQICEEVPATATKEFLQKFVEEVVKVKNSAGEEPDAGASLRQIENLLVPFCKICSNHAGIGGPLATGPDDYGRDVFGSKWNGFAEADKKRIIDEVFSKPMGYNPWFIMRLIKDHFDGKPMYFDHPHTRFLNLEIQDSTPESRVHIEGMQFTAAEYLGTELAAFDSVTAGALSGGSSAPLSTAAELFHHRIATGAGVGGSDGDGDTDMAVGDHDFTPASNAEPIIQELKAIPPNPSRIIGMFMGRSMFEDTFLLNLDRRPVGYF